MLAIQGSLALIAGLLATPYIATAQSTTSAATPGCYGYCRYLDMGSDSTGSEDLCNASTAIGSLFTKNMVKCADCVRENNGLNSTWFDTNDAQDTLRVVNSCQVNFPTNHSTIVSAMSVIKQYGTVLGTIAPAQTTASATRSPTSVPATATATSSSEPVTNDTKFGSKAWIAGAVMDRWPPWLLFSL